MKLHEANVPEYKLTNVDAAMLFKNYMLHQSLPYMDKRTKSKAVKAIAWFGAMATNEEKKILCTRGDARDEGAVVTVLGKLNTLVTQVLAHWFEKNKGDVDDMGILRNFREASEP